MNINRLKDLREDNNLTQKEIANMLKTSLATVFKI